MLLVISNPEMSLNGGRAEGRGTRRGGSSSTPTR